MKPMRSIERLHEISSSENEEDIEDPQSLLAIKNLSDHQNENIRSPTSSKDSILSTNDGKRTGSDFFPVFRDNSALLTPFYETDSNPLIMIPQDLPQVISSSPDNSIPRENFEIPYFDFESFVKLGFRFTDTEFAKAIDGIDFASIFD
jgi:hypothetical protein